MKRTHLIASATAVALLPAGAALASAPPDTPAPGGAGTGMPATIYNDDRDPIATVTAGPAEIGWTNYGEDNAPDEGNEYLRMTVTVTNAGEDDFSVSLGDFVLQDNQGRLDGGDSVESPEEEADDIDATTEADLGAGESIDLTITFQYDAAAGPQSVFYRQGEDWLVDVAEIAPGAAAPEGTMVAPAGTDAPVATEMTMGTDEVMVTATTIG